MIGTIVNALAIVAGSIIGLLCRGGIPPAYNQTVMQAIGLAVILIGFKSALKADDLLLVIFSLAIGSVLGEGLKIELRLERLGQWLQRRMALAGDGIAKGFVSASLLFCVGSMAIVGPLESGLSGNHQTRKILENEGVEVLEYKGEEISLKGGGGPTCLTRPLLRVGN